MLTLVFDHGTLRLSGDDVPMLVAHDPTLMKYDERIAGFRARACDYAPILLAAQKMNLTVTDEAKDFAPIEELKLAVPIIPRPHQKTAFEKWQQAQYRAVAALPTGSGKTILAVMAIARLKRPTLILVPTIDLLVQWANVLERFFDRPVGIWGGGSSTDGDIVVSTYNSAVLKLEYYGNRFAFLVADECHHLPGPVNQLAAVWSLAPYRLGLSATPENDEKRDAVLGDLMGPVCCRVEIKELTHGVLADYEVETIELELTAEEEKLYEKNRKVYLNFLHSRGVVMNSLSGWQKFMGEVARSGAEGREALEAYLAQRNIARSGEAKLAQVWELLTLHAGERIIIFTADNATAYEIGRRYLLPVLTHHTHSKERKLMLENFRSGACPVLVSSKVLNEGVDVPEANIGIVVSGGSGTREHVQRLGRILRARPGKKAILYELVNSGTSERGAVNRRRENSAYLDKLSGGGLC